MLMNQSNNTTLAFGQLSWFHMFCLDNLPLVNSVFRCAMNYPYCDKKVYPNSPIGVEILFLCLQCELV
jgi:hypothetical protein